MSRDGLRCFAAKDGECYWEQCPQRRDNEPHFSGRDCPHDLLSIAKNSEDDEVYLAECRGCNGTGIYVGEKEKPGEAVVCIVCEGAGGLYTSVGTTYRGRKFRHGIGKVRLESLTSPAKDWLSYEDFLDSFRSAAGAPVIKPPLHSRRDAVNATKLKRGLL